MLPIAMMTNDDPTCRLTHRQRNKPTSINLRIINH